MSRGLKVNIFDFCYLKYFICFINMLYNYNLYFIMCLIICGCRMVEGGYGSFLFWGILCILLFVLWMLKLGKVKKL